MHRPVDEAGQRRLRLVHQLRGISVELDLARSAFAQANGLHDTDVRALIALLDAGRAGVQATPGWLGAQLGLTSASTTALIDRLAAAGYVLRRPSATDRRKVELHVSDQAVDLGWEFFGPLLAGMMRAMEPFSADELGVAERFLGEVAAATRWTSQPPPPPG